MGSRAIEPGVAAAYPNEVIPPGRINLWISDGYHGSYCGYYLDALVVFGSVTGRDAHGLGRTETRASQLGNMPAEAAALPRIAFQRLAAKRRATVVPVNLGTRLATTARTPCPLERADPNGRQRNAGHGIGPGEYTYGRSVGAPTGREGPPAIDRPLCAADRVGVRDS